MHTKQFLLVLFIVGSLKAIFAYNEPECASRQTCSDCIQTPKCSWCSDPNFNDHRCFQISSSENGCSEKYIFSPDNIMSVLQNRDINRSNDFASKNDFPSIMPQKIQLKLRKGSSHILNIKYRMPDLPIDIYYLIDAKSMKKDIRKKVIHLSEELISSLKNLTTNYRIGLGSYVDKVVAPFVDTNPKKLFQPCDECSAPYGFRHILSLTTDSNIFLNEVDHIQKSGNLNSLNGGLDALMQSIMCPGQIGWRSESVKFIIFVSNSGVHISGDGKQAGITEPNDMNCHLDSSGFYTRSSYSDYPSIYQINDKVKQLGIRTIFAVTESEVQYYRIVSNGIEGSTVVKLSEDSSNIDELLARSLKKAKSIPEFKHTSCEAISVKLINAAFIIEEKDIVIYKFNIKVETCNVEAKKNVHNIKIFPVGKREELTVELEAMCSCPCESPGNILYEENSNHCSNRGTYKCGICECSQETYGRSCECNRSTHEDDCIFGNNITEISCSGRGACICGNCLCDTRPNELEKLYGKYCECDNFSCDRYNGKLCSDHGECDCGICKCFPGWIGSACSCSANNAQCINPGNNLICSGHGSCTCGQCVCDTIGKVRYSGKFCENIV